MKTIDHLKLLIQALEADPSIRDEDIVTAMADRFDASLQLKPAAWLALGLPPPTRKSSSDSEYWHTASVRVGEVLYCSCGQAAEWEKV